MATRKIRNINNPINYNNIVYHKDIQVKDVNYLVLSANTTNNITIVETGITENIIISYQAVRGSSIKKGDIEIIYDSSDPSNNLFIDSTTYSELYTSGVTFDAEINSGIIELVVFINNDANDVDFNYSIKYFK